MTQNNHTTQTSPLHLTNEQADLDEGQFDRQLVELRVRAINYPGISRALKTDEKQMRKRAASTWSRRTEQLRDEGIALTFERIELAMRQLANAVHEGESKAIDQWTKLCALENQLHNTAMKQHDKQEHQLTLKIVCGIDMEEV